MSYDIAVITPFYNTEEYLHRCIQSVLNQKDVRVQCFLIDDCSSDNGFSIAQYYQKIDSRVVLLKNDKNLGQGESRNKAINQVNARYVYFLDSDDYIETDHSLKHLYDVAEANKLDICSPDVPSHYFERPLEAIACIPCKSQFIRVDIIKNFNILQPNARSGQDGVFSHLVLSHCSRIGMTKGAKLFYTHAREGSTFQKYLKKHDVVADIVKCHYEAIVGHYNQYNLWQKNALRLSFFLTDETIRNRITPHFDYMSDVDKEVVFSLLKEVAVKILEHLPKPYENIVHPIILELAKSPVDVCIRNFNKYDKSFKQPNGFVKNENIVKKDLIICKIADKDFIPNKAIAITSQNQLTQNNPSINYGPVVNEGVLARSEIVELKESVLDLKSEFGALKGKLDLAINTINSSAIRTISAIRSEPTNASRSGKKDFIVSLTTLPHRLPLVHYAIESILSQTILPEKVVLWISNQTPDALITPELKSLMERGLEIKKVQDVGPHTKLMYSLIEYPNKVVVTVDDDIIYPMNALQYLWEQHIKFPNAVVANWARELTFDKDGKVKGVRSGKLLTPILLEKEIEQAKSFVAEPNLLGFPYGTSGVLYPPKSLNQKVTDVDLFRKLCPKEDDIWFRAMGILNKTPVVVTNLGINPVHHSLVGTQQEALRHHNHGLNQNEKQMQAVFEYFDLYAILGR